MSNSEPLLLDLYCGAGGAAVGYQRVGFNPVGIDYLFQKHYPFKFHMMRAVDFLLSPYFIKYNFVAIHASPPCQLHSKMSQCRFGEPELNTHRDHISEIRPLLQQLGLPYIIENVLGAPLVNPVKICGASVPGIYTLRHRYFESNVPLIGIDCPPIHPVTRQTLRNTKYVGVNAKGSRKHHLVEGLGIDWMTVREMQQAIPPAYTEHLGKQLINLI